MDAHIDMRARIVDYISRDNCSSGMGMEVLAAGPGSLHLRMTIRNEHLNFLGWCHGGVLFTLADTCFGMAANTYDRAAVGIDTHMAYLSGAREGDVIEAEAVEVSRTKRKAVHRVDITRPSDGKAIATFTGTVFITDQLLTDV